MRLPFSQVIRKMAQDLKNSFRIEREDAEEEGRKEEPSLEDVVYTPGSGGGGTQQYSTNNPRQVEDPDSLKEKSHISAPKIKPKRRSVFNESETRGYRRDYQEKYREENGNGYIKKLKKPEERENA
jgi:hypothetical protein